jgi:HAD superfamily hydrolase (TIGR01509 family)
MANFAVIFDMDGVIVDSNPAHKIALNEFCTRYGFDLSEAELREKIYGRSNKDWIPNLFGEITKEQLKIYATEKETLFRDIYKDSIEAVAGIQSFLEKLEVAKIDKAIGTSAPPENVVFTLRHTQLESFFSTIRNESHIQRGKPDPEIYLLVAEALGYAPARCVVFEDSLSGVESANRAGCKVIGVSTTHTPEELSDTSFVISDFKDLEISQIEALFND